MNQKFIIRLSVALALVLGTVASAQAKKADANAYQDVNGPALTVSGVITDVNGEPLPGASVMIKGSSTGTVSDLDGKFTLPAKQGQTLVVSYIGFRDHEFTAQNAKQNVALESDSTILDDVVVVGYGAQKKANLTGSVDHVDSKIFQNRAFGTATQMLNETMPNVEMVVTNGQPYQEQYMSIRGNITNVGNINVGGGEGGTLILIDGVEGDLSLVNPNDIESVTVLKDAASAAIYGARGSVGVILVETKSGEGSKEKFTINYTGDFNFSSPMVKPDYLTDGLEYAKLAREAVGMYYADAKGNYQASKWSKMSSYKNAINFKNGMGNTIDGYYSMIKEYRDAGNIDPVSTDKTNWLYFGNTDWYDELYKETAFSQVHSLSTSGSSGKISYYVSGRLYDYQGIYNYDADTYKTMNIRAKVSAQILPWLKLTENMDYTYDKIHKPLSTKGTSTYTPEKAVYKFGNPSASIYNPDGTLTQSGSEIFGSMMNHSSFKNINTGQFKTTTTLDASFFKNTLRLKADYTYKTKNKDARQKVTSIDYSEKVGVITNALGSEMYQQYMSQANTFKTTNTFNAYAEYENTWNKHYFKGMAGYNYETREQQYYKVEQQGLMDPQADSFERLITALPSDWSTEYVKYRDAGLFFRFNYIFDERYLLEVNGRYDGSSKFPAKQQWAFFPSVSGGWRVSAEPWFKVSPKFISNLKFRASYGELGDGSSLGAYGYEELFEKSSFVGKRVVDGSSSYTYYSYPEDFNSHFSWATIKTSNFGGDIGFLNGKLNVSYDYFIRRTCNMICGSSDLSPTYGSTSAIGNRGQMSGYGWELVVNYNDTYMVGGKPFNISVRGTLADNHQHIDVYPNATKTINKSGAYYEGMTIGEIWGYRVGGIWNNFEEIDNWQYTDPSGEVHTTKYNMTTSIKQNDTKHRFLPGQVWFKDLDGDGTITKTTTADAQKDMEIIGNKYPHFNYSLGINLDWNGIFLNVLFSGVGKQDWSGSNGAMFGLYTKDHNLMPNYLVGNTWTSSNQNAFWPALNYGSAIFSGETNVWNGYVSGVPTDRYTFNIGYIKLKNLQIGYNLPKKVIKKIGLSGLKIYFTGENLWDWSPVYKYIKGFNVGTISAHVDDDDMFNFGSDSVGSQYPIMRTCSFGISITI